MAPPDIIADVGDGADVDVSIVEAIEFVALEVELRNAAAALEADAAERLRRETIDVSFDLNCT
jgi:hypothetical protein